MAGKIFTGQKYTVRLNTGFDVSTATTLQIRRKFPEVRDSPIDIVEAQLVIGSDEIIEAVIPSSINITAGKCEHYAWVTFSDDPGPVPGDPLIERIYAV